MGGGRRVPETSPDFKGSGWRGPGVRDGDGVHSTIVRGSVHKLNTDDKHMFAVVVNKSRKVHYIFYS